MENIKMVNSRSQSQALHGFRNKRKRLGTEYWARMSLMWKTFFLSITNAQYTTMVRLCLAVWWIGHFRVPKNLTFKMRPSAQPFLWKRVLFAWEWKIVSTSKAEHLTSFWYRGPGELRNGPLTFVVVFPGKTTRGDFTKPTWRIYERH